MKEMKYLSRIADKTLDLRLEAFGAVQIAGPKWCGKTTTAERRAASVIKMQDPDRREGYLATSRTKPSLLLKGDTPRLIDEWQVAPIIWDAVRHAVDERREKGQFILTGSTVIDDDEIMHTGTGRISKMAMYPMVCSNLLNRMALFHCVVYLMNLIMILTVKCRNSPLSN